MSSAERTICIHGHFYQPPAGKPMAGDRRGAGVGRSLARLERAHHRGVLCAEQRGPHRQSAERNHPHPEQLRADELQLWADAALLARTERAARARGHRPCRSAQPEALLRPRLGHGADLQPRDHAAGQPARPHHAGSLGHRRLSASLWARTGGHVAAGNRGRFRIARSARTAWHPVRPARAAPVRAVQVDGARSTVSRGQSKNRHGCEGTERARLDRHA